jgi:aspartyl-tRNA synthetase
MKTRTSIAELPKLADQTATINGWINVRRDHGKLAFFEIRDASSMVQAVYFKKGGELDELVNKLRPEFVVEITGAVKSRPEKMVNPDHPTGTIEFEIQQLKILSSAETPPFEITEAKVMYTKM